MNNIDTLLETIENSTDIELLNYLGGIFASTESKKEMSNWADVKNNLALMKNYISENIEDLSKRENFLECADNLEETKQRLLLIFKQVYKSVFINIETEVLAIIENHSKSYEALLNINPVEFVKKYFLNIFDPVNNEWKYKIKVHFSLFLIMGFQFISLHDCIEKEGRCLLGIHTNDMFKSKNMKDKLDKFSRALADERRLNIIKLLSEKPCYGYEIAGKLNLTPATINYHMNFLLLADLLILEKVDNKVYYTLNKENLKELFDEFQRYLLNE